MVEEDAPPESQSLLADEDEMNIESGGYPNGSMVSLQRTFAKTE